MEEGNFAVIVDAKSEYTQQLVNVLRGGIYQGIKRIFKECREKCESNGDLSGVLNDFQSKLEEVPKWNQEVILGECDTLLTESKCDWIEDLITAVFVSHTRVLTSINFSKNKKQINLKIPKTDHFIHQCYIDIARIFYKVPYLMDDTTGRYEFQRNRNEAELLIEKSIETTIRKQLPVKHILQEYLGNDYIAKDAEEETTAPSGFVETKLEEKVESTEENEPTPKLSDLSMDIKELVKTEIENSVKALENTETPPPDYTDGTPIEINNELESTIEPVVSTETVAPEALAETVAPEAPVESTEMVAPAAPAESVNDNLDTEEQSFLTDLGDLDLDLDLDLSTEEVDLGSTQESIESVESGETGEINVSEENLVKSLNLAETHSVLPEHENSGIELGNDEVKTILLDTKNSLTDEDIEKKRNLKNKKAYSFFNDSLEEDSE